MDAVELSRIERGLAPGTLSDLLEADVIECVRLCLPGDCMMASRPRPRSRGDRGEGTVTCEGRRGPRVDDCGTDGGTHVSRAPKECK